MKKILFLALGFSLLFAPSCKDFLQKDNPNSPTETIFWQTTSDFDMALTAIYGLMRGPLNYTQSFSIPGNFMSTFSSWYDNFTDNSVTNSDQDGTNTVLMDNISPENMPGLTGIYNALYQRIARINIFLDYLETNTNAEVQAKYNQYKGEALALRALNYHYLYIYFGSVPVVKERLNTDNMYKEKVVKEEVYKAVIEDFDEAIRLLPESQLYSANPGHMTRAAAIGFRARTRLYHAYNEQGQASTAEMGEILAELNQIKAPYKLADDVLENFISDKQEACPEIMFSLKFLKPDMRNQIDFYIGAWKRMSPTRDLVYAFPNADGTAYVPDPNIEKQMYPDSKVREEAEKKLRESLKAQGLSDKEIEKKVKEFNDAEDAKVDALYAQIFANRDPRLAMFIAPNGLYDFSEYFEKSAKFKDGNAPVTHFAVRKLVTPLDGLDNNGKDVVGHTSWDGVGYSWQSDQDVVLMRWTHILLMRAEAAYWANGATAAEPYINELRDRVGMPHVSGITFEQLQNEIRIETCFEGLRYYDMKRWRILSKMNGKPHDPSVTGNVIINPAHFDWPIPYEEIRQAKDHGVNLVQNPGYTN